MKLYHSLQDRVLTHYDAIKQIQTGSMPAPRTAIVYPTYGCNLDCVGCEYAVPNEEGFRGFNRDQLKSVLDQLIASGVQGIEFCGGGEPTLFPELGALVSEYDPDQVRFGLLTNGVTLSSSMQVVAATHFDYIRISMDAGSKEMYAQCRPAKSGNPWNRILANIGMLTEIRDRNPGSRLRVSYKMLVSKINQHELRDAVSMANELHCDSVQFKALRLHESELSPLEAEQNNLLIENLRKEFSDIAVVGNLTKLEMKKQCILTPLQTTIDPLGEVYLCCYYLHRKERHSIGNILKQPFSEIWGGARHREAIAGIEPKECNNLDCRFVRYHDVVDEAMGPSGGQFEFI